MYITTILSLLSYFYDLQKVHKGSRGRKFIYYTIYEEGKEYDFVIMVIMLQYNNCHTSRQKPEISAFSRIPLEGW